jgi:hypothetical protein
MLQKSEAIFLIWRPKVTYAMKKQSDISSPEALGHPCHPTIQRPGEDF